MRTVKVSNMNPLADMPITGFYSNSEHLTKDRRSLVFDKDLFTVVHLKSNIWVNI